MDFSLKRWGAHFCPPPIWAAKKACFFASVPSSWACCPHVFSFSFTSILCFSSRFLHIFPFFCQIFCLSKRKLADLGSNLLCFWWSSHANFAEFSDLYGWNYPAHPSVWLKLPCTPFCELLGLRLYLKPANFKRIIQKKERKWWQFEKIIVNLQL